MRGAPTGAYPRLCWDPPLLGFCLASPKRQTSYVYLDQRRESQCVIHPLGHSLSGVLVQTRALELLPLALRTEPLRIEQTLELILCLVKVLPYRVERILCILIRLPGCRVIYVAQSLTLGSMHVCTP